MIWCGSETNVNRRNQDRSKKERENLYSLHCTCLDFYRSQFALVDKFSWNWCWIKAVHYFVRVCNLPAPISKNAHRTWVSLLLLNRTIFDYTAGFVYIIPNNICHIDLFYFRLSLSISCQFGNHTDDCASFSSAHLTKCISL